MRYQLDAWWWGLPAKLQALCCLAAVAPWYWLLVVVACWGRG